MADQSDTVRTQNYLDLGHKDKQGILCLLRVSSVRRIHLKVFGLNFFILKNNTISSKGLLIICSSVIASHSPSPSRSLDGSQAFWTSEAKSLVAGISLGIDGESGT